MVMVASFFGKVIRVRREIFVNRLFNVKTTSPSLPAIKTIEHKFLWFIGIAARDLRILLMFYQHPAWFNVISKVNPLKLCSSADITPALRGRFRGGSACIFRFVSFRFKAKRNLQRKEDDFCQLIF